MVLPLPSAHAAVVAFSLTPSVVLLATGDLTRAVTVALPIGLIAIAISVAMATTTSRTERVSAERQALIDELASSRAEVARLSRAAGVAEERQRLAGEIHDTVAQGLSSVVMLIEAALANPLAARQHLELAARTARENLDETRAIVAALTPAPLDGASLEDALRRVTDRFAAETGIAADLDVTGVDRPLPIGVEVVLLRVVQEALTNVRKHAGAQHVAVRLAVDPGQASVEVSDDGCGFDPAAPESGYGIRAMRNRVEQVDGRLLVHSRPGHGATVQAEVVT
jgi:signal transduction histidine kinase